LASGGYIIREASSSDLNGIMELLDPELFVMNEYHNRIATIKHAITHGARGCLVADDDALVVGFLRYSVSKINSASTIEELIVKEGRRRQGIGRALLDIFREKGYGQLIAKTNMLDVRYVEFLAHCGFYANDNSKKKFMKMKTDGEQDGKAYSGQ
jgi:N-acetylglutamate synthase-like GNAT family acetyltransferase